MTGALENITSGQLWAGVGQMQHVILQGDPAHPQYEEWTETSLAVEPGLGVQLKKTHRLA